MATVLGAGLIGVSAAQARELRYAMGFPPGPDLGVAGKKYAERVEELTDGELSVKVYALSLLNFVETPIGVSDGMADIGYVLTPYFPQQFPHMNLVAEFSMLLHLQDDKVRGREGYAYVGAMAEFVFLNCPECQQDMAKQNQVMTANAGSSQYGLTCTRKVTTMDELKGTRLRVAGFHWSRWAEAFGAVSVTLSSNEAAEALSQGVVDCVVISAPELMASVCDFVEKDIDPMAEYYKTERGVANSERMTADFREILGRWVELVQDVETVEDLSGLYWDEVYSKIDVTTHGM